MAVTPQVNTFTDAEVQRAEDFADAALAVVGHEVTDEHVRAITRRMLGGEITGDQAAELIIAYSRAELIGGDE